MYLKSHNQCSQDWREVLRSRFALMLRDLQELHLSLHRAASRAVLQER